MRLLSPSRWNQETVETECVCVCGSQRKKKAENKKKRRKRKGQKNKKNNRFYTMCNIWVWMYLLYLKCCDVLVSLCTYHSVYVSDGT